MRPGKEAFKAVFLAVATQYQPISRAQEYTEDERRIMKFKSFDAETGNIYLIDHPDAWRKEFNAEGRPILYRSPPKLLYTFEAAKREMNKPNSAEIEA